MRNDFYYNGKIVQWFELWFFTRSTRQLIDYLESQRAGHWVAGGRQFINCEQLFMIIFETVLQGFDCLFVVFRVPYSLAHCDIDIFRHTFRCQKSELSLFDAVPLNAKHWQFGSAINSDIKWILQRDNKQANWNLLNGRGNPLS